MKPFQLGITGGIGSGKSVVCKVLSAMEIPVFHADEVSKNLLDTDSKIMLAVKDLIGSEAYSSSGANRKFIASVVFNDHEKLIKLNNILHPAVQVNYLKWIEQHMDQQIVAKEAAIMFESGSNNGMDAIAVITAPVELRIQRVIDRDEKKREEILNIMAKQLQEEDIVQKSDFVIVNDNRQLVLPQIIDMLNSIKSKVA